MKEKGMKILASLQAFIMIFSVTFSLIISLLTFSVAEPILKASDEEYVKLPIENNYYDYYVRKSVADKNEANVQEDGTIYARKGVKVYIVRKESGRFYGEILEEDGIKYKYNDGTTTLYSGYSKDNKDLLEFDTLNVDTSRGLLENETCALILYNDNDNTREAVQKIHIDENSPTTILEEQDDLYNVTIPASYEHFTMKASRNGIVNNRIHRAKDNIVYTRPDVPFYIVSDDENRKFKVVAYDEQGIKYELDNVTEGGITKAIELRDYVDKTNNYNLWLHIYDKNSNLLQKIEVKVEFNTLVLDSENEEYEEDDMWGFVASCDDAKQDTDNTLYVLPNSEIYLDLKYEQDNVVYSIEDKNNFSFDYDENLKKYVLTTKGKIGDETNILLGTDADDLMPSLKVVISNGIIDATTCSKYNGNYTEEYKLNDSTTIYTTLTEWADMTGKESIISLVYYRKDVGKVWCSKEDITVTDLTGCLTTEPELNVFNQNTGQNIGKCGCYNIKINAKQEGILRVDVKDYKQETQSLYIKIIKEGNTREQEFLFTGNKEYEAWEKENQKYKNNKTTEKMPEVKKIIKQSEVEPEQQVYQMNILSNELKVNKAYYYLKSVNDETNILELNNQELETFINEKCTEFDLNFNQSGLSQTDITVNNYQYEDDIYNLYVFYKYSDDNGMTEKIACERTDTIITVAHRASFKLYVNNSADSYSKEMLARQQLYIDSYPNIISGDFYYYITNKSEMTWEYDPATKSIKDGQNVIQLEMAEKTGTYESLILVEATPGVNENKYVFIYYTDEKTGATTVVRTGSIYTVGEDLKVIGTNAIYNQNNHRLYIDVIFNKTIYMDQNQTIELDCGEQLGNVVLEKIANEYDNAVTFACDIDSINGIKENIQSVISHMEVKDNIGMTATLSDEEAQKICDQIKALQADNAIFEKIEVNIETDDFIEEENRIIVKDNDKITGAMTFNNRLVGSAYSWARVFLDTKEIADFSVNSKSDYEIINGKYVYSTEIGRQIKEGLSYNGRFSILEKAAGFGAIIYPMDAEVVYKINGVETEKEIIFSRLPDINIHRGYRNITDENIIWSRWERLEIFTEYKKDNLEEIYLYVKFYGQGNDPIIKNNNGDIIEPQLRLDNFLEENEYERGYVLTAADLPIRFEPGGIGDYEIIAKKKSVFGQEKIKEFTVQVIPEGIELDKNGSYVQKNEEVYMTYHDISSMQDEEKEGLLATYLNYMNIANDDKLLFKAAIRLGSVPNPNNVKVYINNQKAVYTNPVEYNNDTVYLFKIPVINTGVNEIRIENAEGQVLYRDEVNMCDYGLYKRGDTNKDGKISPEDATTILKRIAKFDGVDNVWTDFVGDVNNDGEVDVSDVVTICRFVAEDREVMYQWVKESDN